MVELFCFTFSVCNITYQEGAPHFYYIMKPPARCDPAAELLWRTPSFDAPRSGFGYGLPGHTMGTVSALKTRPACSFYCSTLFVLILIKVFDDFLHKKSRRMARPLDFIVVLLLILFF